MSAKGHLFPAMNEGSTQISAIANLEAREEVGAWEDCHSDVEEDSNGEAMKLCNAPFYFHYSSPLFIEGSEEDVSPQDLSTRQLFVQFGLGLRPRKK